MTNLQGKVAVVTGSGRGVGRQAAFRLASLGAGVTLIARSAEQLRETAALIEAARKIFERVEYLTELQLHDVARAPQILEQSVHDVAAAIRNKTAEDEVVENLEAYLYRAVVRKINDIQARERRIEYVHSLELLERLAARGEDDWVTAFQRDLQLEEILSHLDPRTREIFTRRASGDSWDEVAKAMGISGGDNDFRILLHEFLARREHARSNKLQARARNQTSKDSSGAGFVQRIGGDDDVGKLLNHTGF